MVAKTEGAAGELLRILGIGFGLAVVVGGVIGQGIMRTPGIVAGALPSEAWILGAWALGGLIILVDACSTVELGTALPHTGGPYVFAARAFGAAAGSMVGWGTCAAYVISSSYITVVFAEYVHRLGFATVLPTGALAAMLAITMAAINASGTRCCGVSQIVGTAIKGLGLTFLIVLIWLLPAAPGGAAPAAPGPQPVLTIAAFAIAMRPIAITFAGWAAPVYCSEELHAPERNIVRATFGGIALVIVLYLAVNGALFHVLTRAEIAASTLPVADAAARALGPASGTAITVLALLSVIAICNLQIMIAARIVFAMARGGVLPARLTQVSTNGAPRAALLCTCIVIVILASTGSYERLIAIGAPFTVGVPACVDLAAIALRRREPQLARPFRMPLFPLPPLIGFSVNSLLIAAIFYEDPFDSCLGVALVAAIAFAARMRGLLPVGKPVATGS